MSPRGVAGNGGVADNAVIADNANVSDNANVADRLLNTFNRTNYRGRTVTLLAGPVGTLVGSLTAAAAADDARLRRAALGVGLFAGGLGLYDDLVGSAPNALPAKGFRGHLGALRGGRVSSGLVKLVGVSVAGVLAAGPVTRTPLDRLITGGVVAGTANLVNLLDLRPGRALKSVLLLGAPVLLAGGAPARLLVGPYATAAVLLPPDLAERTMLGDCGANSLGALLGLAAAAACPRGGRVALLAVLVAVTLLSERVSLGAVIGRTPALRALDGWGRGSTADAHVADTQVTDEQ